MKRFLAACLLAFAFSAFAQSLPFVPSATVNVAVTGTAQSLTLSNRPVIAPLGQVVLTNVGTQTVFFTTDGTTATVANGMPILANSQFVLSVPVSSVALSAIAANTGSTLYATMGVGQ